MAIVWPASLPSSFDVGTFKTSPVDVAIHTPTDLGSGKSRKRFSRAPVPLSGRMSFTEAQTLELDEFFEESTASGTLVFHFPNPRGDGVISVKFEPDKPPQYAEQAAQDLYRVVISLVKIA